jgi:2-keto-4-pentenoate hydratase
MSTAVSGRIVSDILSGQPFQRYADEVGTDLSKAYRIQDAVTEQLLEDVPGRCIAGYKIAFNKASSLAYYGLSEPCIAPVFSDLVVARGARFDASRYRDFVIEPELVITLSQDLVHDADRDDADLARHVASVRAGIELMDVRGAFAHDPSAAEAVAQGVYNVGAILGPEKVAIGALDIERITTTLHRNGKLEGEATGAAPQHPLDVLRWLSERLGRDGKALKAGMIVLCGTHLPGYPVSGTASIEIAMGPLGKVGFDFV